MLFSRSLYCKEAHRVFAHNRKNLLISALIMWGFTTLISCAGAWCSAAGGDSLFMSVLLAVCAGIVFFAFVSFVVRCDAGDAPAWTLFLDYFDRFWVSTRATLWFLLWSVLWFFLVIIPGFVKMIAYSQMFFVLAENPQISVRQAMRMSLAMTNGHKGDLFIMFLSFIGWILLGFFTFGLAFIWAGPYMHLAFYKSYQALKNEALDKRILCAADFATAATQDNVTQDNVAQNNATQDNVTQDNVTQDNVTQDNVTQDNVTQDNVAQDNVTQDNVVQDNVTLDNVTQNNEAQDNVTQDNVTQNNVTQNNVITKEGE